MLFLVYFIAEVLALVKLFYIHLAILVALCERGRGNFHSAFASVQPLRQGDVINLPPIKAVN